MADDLDELHRQYLERGRAAFESQDLSKPFFLPPDYVDTLVVTHLLELPRDLNLADTGLLLSEPREDVFPGYPPDVVSAIVEAPAPPEGALPSTRLLFARTRVRGRMPLQAADLCFGHWTRAFHSDEEWEERSRQLDVAQKVGIEVPVTVAAATRFVAPSEWGETRDGQEEVLARELDAALDVLNYFIVSLGLTLNQPRLAPIDRGELPWLCPVIVEGVPMSEGVRVGATFIYQINDVGFGLQPGEEVKEELVQHAAELTKLAYFDAEPFFLFLELMHRCQATGLTHRHAEAMTTLGTAIEVLLSTVIREAAAALNESAAQTEAALRAGYRQKLEHHLPRYCGLVVDLDDATNAAGGWWQGGYRLRNKIVHEGYRPTTEEAVAAWRGAGELVTGIREGFRSRPETEDLALRLAWGPTEEREWLDRLIDEE